MFRFNTVFLVAALVAAVPLNALAFSHIVINEVDYDQPGPDEGGEFIELKNISPNTINLAGYSIELVNGVNPPGTVPFTLEMPPEVNVPAGGYFVICRSAATSTLTSEECDRNAPVDMVVIPNGNRDGIRLLKDGEVQDMLSWGLYMDGLTEGLNPAPKDLDNKDNYSLSRTPDGSDSDTNDVDFKWTCSSPRKKNYTAEECQCIQTVCGDGNVCNPLTGYCEVVEVPEDVIEDTAGSDTSTGEDVSEPLDTAVQDSLDLDAMTGDLSGTDTRTDATVSTDTPSGYDVNFVFDLGGLGHEDTGGNGASDGCSAGRHPVSAGTGLLLLLLACMSFLAVRITRKASRT